MSEQKKSTPTKETNYVEIGDTTFEVVSVFDGEISYYDLIKNAIRREIESHK